MQILKSTSSMHVKGDDAYSFIDSLVSNSIIKKENENKFSYLLGPDGKVKFWFIYLIKNSELKIYQSEDNLTELKNVLEKYKIRINCELIISKEDSFFEVLPKEDLLIVQPTSESDQFLDWIEIEMIYELPSLKIIEMGLLPNEINWLESFVDFNKGCFMGQEQASRINFRGKPRRILKTLSDSTQDIVKI